MITRKEAVNNVKKKQEEGEAAYKVKRAAFLLKHSLLIEEHKRKLSKKIERPRRVALKRVRYNLLPLGAKVDYEVALLVNILIENLHSLGFEAHFDSSNLFMQIEVKWGDGEE